MKKKCDKCLSSIKGNPYFTVDQTLCLGCIQVGTLALSHNPEMLLHLLMEKLIKGKGNPSFTRWVKWLTKHLKRKEVIGNGDHKLSGRKETS